MQAWIRRQDPERIGAGLHERFNKNFAEGGSNYAGFRLSPFGTLTPVSGSTYAVPDGSGLGDVFFNAFGDHLIGTRTGTSLIDSFVVVLGHLIPAKGSPFTGQGLGQLGAEFSPVNPSQLFVSNAHNGTGLGTISAYNDSLLGNLSSIGSSPYADGQTAPCWVEVSHDGKYLFTVNTGSGNISSYTINPNGSLTLIGSTPIVGGGADIDARLSPDGKYLLVDGSGMRFVSVFAVNGGSLTELPSSPTPLPAGVTSSSGIANT
jgi:DNA-binding beta-propeller fold protein YncE